MSNLQCSERKALTVCDLKLFPPLLWVITLRVVVISYRRFGTNYRIYHPHVNLETEIVFTSESDCMNIFDIINNYILCQREIFLEFIQHFLLIKLTVHRYMCKTRLMTLITQKHNKIKHSKANRTHFMADIPMTSASLKSRKLHRKLHIVCNKSDRAVS